MKLLAYHPNCLLVWTLNYSTFAPASLRWSGPKLVVVACMHCCLLRCDDTDCSHSSLSSEEESPARLLVNSQISSDCNRIQTVQTLCSLWEQLHTIETPTLDPDRCRVDTKKVGSVA